MAKNQSKAELEAENRYLRRARTQRDAASVVNGAMRWGTLAFVAYMAKESVALLAGQSTTANLNFLGRLDVSISIAWAVGLSGVAYGWWQRKLRRDTIERLEKRIAELETIVDPKRTSSRLTQRGDTRPEDRI